METWQPGLKKKPHFWIYQYLLVWMFRYTIQYKMCLYFQFHWFQTTIVTLHRTSARRITKTLRLFQESYWQRNIPYRDLSYLQRGWFGMDRRRQDLYLKRNSTGQTLWCGFLWCETLERQLKEVDKKFTSLKWLGIWMGLHSLCTS